MAGHSKFKNIMHRKGAQDAKRAKIFTKVGREIIVAAKLSGPDPDMNPRLRLAIQKARAVNMPNDRIKKAIQTGSGAGDGEDYQEIRYEGYGPGGVAIIVDTLTDNRNRTVSEVRSTLTKYNGSLGETNSVSFMFDRAGEIIYSVGEIEADVIFEKAVEAGASNCESTDEAHEITTEPDDFASVREALVEVFGEPERSGLIWSPNTMVEVDEEQAASLLKMIDVLEDCDDVQNVTTNFDVSDELMTKLMG